MSGMYIQYRSNKIGGGAVLVHSEYVQGGVEVHSKYGQSILFRRAVLKLWSKYVSVCTCFAPSVRP